MINVLGIDCSSDKKKVGISIGEYSNGKHKVKDVFLLKNIKLNEVVNRWYDYNKKNLIAIDAPLGWPIEMGSKLQTHFAGICIDVEANNLFRRETDRFVKKVTNKQPLDVGADKIARTAYAGLKLLNDISKIIRLEINLAWDFDLTQSVSVIEVYPALTLQQHNIRSDRYKNKENKTERIAILNGLKRKMDIYIDDLEIEKSDDILDSIVCQLSACDFLNGDVELPKDMHLAKKEGWIWFKR